MIRTSNSKASYWVTELQDFEGSNTFGRMEGDIYCVYSYGKHWVMYMNINDEWIGCNEKRSPSTSKQSTQLHPNAKVVYWTNQKELQNIKRNVRNK